VRASAGDEFRYVCVHLGQVSLYGGTDLPFSHLSTASRSDCSQHTASSLPRHSKLEPRLPARAGPLSENYVNDARWRTRPRARRRRGGPDLVRAR
jgi:hypothetical protein